MRGVHIKPVSNPLAKGRPMAAEGSSACKPKVIGYGQFHITKVRLDRRERIRFCSTSPNYSLCPVNQAAGLGISIHSKP